MIAWPSKDPDSRIRYWFDASQLVADEGSPVASYVLAIDNPPDSSLAFGGDTRSGSVIEVWLTGGTETLTYVVRCRVTLANGTIEDLSRELLITPH